MSVADLMEAMAKAGAPMDAIIMAVRALAEKEAAIRAAEKEAADKRAAHAEWKRLNRAAKKAMDGPSDVHGLSMDETENPPVLDKETSPRPPKEINPTPRVRRAREAGTRLPDDWKPVRFNDGTVAREVVDRRGQDWGRRARESFENHWRSANGPNAVKRDWQAAFANWVIEQDNRDGSRPGQRQPSQSGHGSTVDAAQRALARHGYATG